MRPLPHQRGNRDKCWSTITTALFVVTGPGHRHESSRAEQWRAAWASVGVTCDRVSSTVLVLNLPLNSETVGGTDPPSGPSAQLQRVCAAAAGEPIWVTARMLPAGFRLPSGTCAGVTVRVCENPAIMEAAAAAFGENAPPLVCTYGRPSLAARTLLSALAGAGARLLATADRDDVGNGILATLLADLPTAREWLPDVAGLYEENRLPALLADKRTDEPARTLREPAGE